ncbi:MAG: DEAD/DEAH box helicase [Bdellovibrionota bacterium]
MSTDAQLSWNDLKLTDEMMKLIEAAGYKSPSPVQAQSIPLIMDGKDVLVSSPTGSGKTASFVIPVVEKWKGKNGTYILALSPTREIAQQTGAIFEQFGAPLGLKTVVCIGGASIPVEKEALASSPHIIVATPGRLCDHLERGNVWLDFIQCLIFDEADRMLDMGFSGQIDKITEVLPKERQTLMFSATFAPAVEKLARNCMIEPKAVSIAKTLESTPKIDQVLHWVDERGKARLLKKIVREETGTVIIFTNAKERVFQVWRELIDDKAIEACYIHSDIPQSQREAAIADFKSGKYRVLVATDVVGRGIDVDDVSHVVNYDVPKEAEDYIHRIGRTGRRGKTGIATTFAIPGKDDRTINEIAKLRGVTSPDKPETQAPAPRREQGGRPQQGGRNQRPQQRDGQRPRNDGPRDQRPRNPDQRPMSEQRPRRNEQKPRDHKPREHKPQTTAAPVQAPVPQKSAGIVGWLKKLFKGD